jgi:hypothetical protein
MWPAGRMLPPPDIEGNHLFIQYFVLCILVLINKMNFFSERLVRVSDPCVRKQYFCVSAFALPANVIFWQSHIRRCGRQRKERKKWNKKTIKKGERVSEKKSKIICLTTFNDKKFRSAANIFNNRQAKKIHFKCIGGEKCLIEAVFCKNWIKSWSLVIFFCSSDFRISV